MASVFRETFLSFHREAAERDARLYADLERVLSSLDAARAHFDAMQNHAFDELVRVLERRRVTEDEIGEALAAMRQQRRDGEY